ncbi:phosphate/phosphite/phosphonate ABC transporter substrate-binding protein [Deinococcus oregonensis]|uniref:Phosphate/phosphite/phosphonate ABC transporter substrate-binding protein n=1 Tax=Deinococcus oregonensis TaxID=1805970 RepID=A0ABV6AY14_9DEIO
MKTVLALLLLSSSAALAQTQSGCPAQLTFGVLPSDESTVNARYEPLFDYLQVQTGSKVKYTVGADYAALIVAMANGKLDAGYFGPESYVQATKQTQVIPLVMAENIKTGTGYYSGFYVRSDSPYKSWSDLKGKSLAFVDPNSTSGYLMPLVQLLQVEKIKPEAHFSQVVFAGTHASAILTLINKRVDVIATNSTAIDSALANGQLKPGELRALWVSKKIPNSPIAVSGRLSGTCRAALTKAFLSLRDPKILAGFSAKRFLPATNADYAGIRSADRLKEQLLKK